jgi:hypothetical protein
MSSTCTRESPCNKQLCNQRCITPTYKCDDYKCVRVNDGSGLLLSKCRETCEKPIKNKWIPIYITLGAIIGMIIILIILAYFLHRRRK